MALATWTDGSTCPAGCRCPCCDEQMAALLAETPAQTAARIRAEQCRAPSMRHNPLCAARTAERRDVMVSQEAVRRELARLRGESEASTLDGAAILAVRRAYGGAPLGACVGLARGADRDAAGKGPYGRTARSVPSDITGAAEPPRSWDLALARRAKEGR